MRVKRFHGGQVQLPSKDIRHSPGVAGKLDLSFLSCIYPDANAVLLSPVSQFPLCSSQPSTRTDFAISNSFHGGQVQLPSEVCWEVGPVLPELDLSRCQCSFPFSSLTISALFFATFHKTKVLALINNQSEDHLRTYASIASTRTTHCCKLHDVFWLCHCGLFVSSFTHTHMF